MLGSPGAHVKTTQRSSRMVNDMAARMNSVKTLARAVAAVAVALLAVQAGPAGAAGTAGKSYNISCDTGTTANVSLYNITTGTQFKVRCKIIDQATGAGITGLVSGDITIRQITDVTTNTALTSGTDYTAGNLVEVGSGVYDFLLTISSGVATGDILEIQMREDGGNEVDTERLFVTQYVRVATAGVAGNARYIEVQPTTNADINTAAGTYTVRVRFIDALGNYFNPGTLTWSINRWRDSTGATITTGTPSAAAYDTTNNWYLLSIPYSTALTNGDRQYINIGARIGNYRYLAGFGLTAVTAQTNTPLAVPTFTTPGLFAPANTTTVGNGTDPAGGTVGPGGAATMVDAFTLQTSAGTDTITAASVTLSTVSGVGLVEITNDAGTTVYGSTSNPAATPVAVSLTTSISATTTLTQYRVRVTPLAHAAMPAVPGGTYAVTATVTGLTSTNGKTYADSGSGTLTIDNLSPGDVTGLSATPGNTQLVVNWTNPATDYARTMVLYRATTAISDVPGEGATYTAPGTLGASTIAYVGGTAGAAGTTTITGLTNGTLYNLKVFVQDAYGNWSTPGATTSGTPTAPANTTTVGNGTDPAGGTVGPGGAATMVDAFTLQTSAGTDAITAASVTLSTVSGVGLVEITNDAGTTVYGSTSNPAATPVAVTLTTNISATTTLTQYRVRVTPLSHAAMPAVPGGTYAVTATVTGLTSTNGKTYSDTGSGTLTIDNLSPGDVTGLSATPGNTQLVVNWTNPATDYARTMVLYRATTAISDVPGEGATYTAPGTLGASTIAYVGGTAGAAGTTTITGLTNGTLYNVKVFVQDAYGNWSTPGATTSGTPAVPVISLAVGNGTNPANTALLCPSPTAPTGPTMLDAFTLQALVADDVVTRITVQLAPAGAWINVATVEITDAAGGTTVYGSAIPGGDQVNVYVTGIAPTVAAGAVSYNVRITPKTHAAMPAPNTGQQYATTGTVVSVASNNPRTYGDASSATVTIDNLAPSEVVWSGVTTGATNIQLNWVTATNVVVLRKQGGPVTDSPVEGTTYTAGATIGASTVACAGTMALCNSTGLTAGTAYYFKVFTADACVNYSLGGPVGPLFAGGLNEGSATASTLLPVVGIINPKNPATVTSSGAGFRVQVRAFSRMNAGVAQPFAAGAVRLKAATPAQPFVATCDAANYPIALALNANYPNSTVAATDNHGVYEATVTVAKGAYTLRACATNASGTVLSGPVGITVNDGSAGSPRGDGNLLVRDNGAQLCNDCHAIATHASETVGNKYGSWYAACRDCHTPHSTTNVELIRKQITPPGYRGQQPPRDVVFYDRSTGFAATAYANSGGTGVCQVCHTATTYYRSDGTLAGTHNPNQACTACHAHEKGLKASCTTCHGDKTGTYAAISGADTNANAAPPTAADKVTTTGVKVGAHQAHVNGNGTVATYRTNPIGCADCHPVPNSHNGTTDAAWSVLATNTIVNGTSLAVAPTPAAGLGAYNATWEATPTCTNACHGANLPSNAVKPAPSWTAAGGLTCASCHGAPPPLSATANQNHPQNTTCATCHGAGYVNGGPLAAAAKSTHVNGTLDRITAGCTSCHGELGAPGVTLTANTVKAAPGASGSGTNSFDTTGLATGNAIGAHKAHLAGSTGTPRWRSAVIACNECHLLPPSDTDMAHATGAGTGGARATLTWTGGIAQSTAFETKTASYAQPTCTNVYCHNPKSTDTAATTKTPAWNGATTLAQCGSCHGLPPTTGTAHPTGVTECASCHPGYSATMPTSTSTIAAVNTLAHINGQLDGGGDCTGCHASAQGPRRPIVPEFALAWSHKRSAGGAVTKWDCVVCHMEGDPTTGNTTAVHKDGFVNLRDPDTGANIKGVTFAGTPGSYTATATDATFTTFSRNLGSATLEPAVQAIMINQCLKCHDANGAASTLARVPTTGTAEKPFGTTIAGAAYTGAGVTANGVTGGVADVNAAFATTNSSYHPVTGKQNNWYAKDVRMVAPWNMGVTTRAGTVNLTTWGPLLSCWDCHSDPADTGVITRTVTAHGAAQTLRGTPTYSGTLTSRPASSTTYPVTRPATAVTLCIVCHDRYDTCGGAGTNNCSSATHGAGSAESSNLNSGMTGTMQFACNWCHSSGSLTAVVRPIRGQDVHGVNTVATGGSAKSGRWATANPKPYAFIRNTSLLGDHSPRSILGTTYSPGCDMVTSPCSQGFKTYTVGGTY